MEKEILRNEMIEFAKSQGLDAKSTVVKNHNGQNRDAVIIGKNPGSVHGVFYLDDLMEWADLCDIKEIINRNLKDLEKAENDMATAKKGIFDWENVKERVILNLFNKNMNNEYISNFPTHVLDGTDYVCLYIYVLENSDAGMKTIKITNDMFEHYGCTETELYEAALQNTRKMEFSIISLENLITGISEGQVDCSQQSGIFVLTSKTQTGGAVGIMLPEMLDSAAEIIGENYYILPSSRHEVLLCPVSFASADELKALVMSVNQDYVATEDLLGDQILLYDSFNKKLQAIAA